MTLSLWNTCEESNVLILIVIITDNGLSSQFYIIRPIELHVYICSEAHHKVTWHKLAVSVGLSWMRRIVLTTHALKG